MSITLEEISKIIEDADTQIDMDKLTPDVDLDSIGADSLDIMNILLGVQEATDIDIDDDDIEKLRTARDICDYMNAKA